MAAALTASHPPVTLARARQLLRRWQGLLRLRDWRIGVKLVPPAHFVDDRWGECEACMDAREAAIRIASNIPPKLLEEVVVHELLHCFTAALPATGPEPQRHAEEQLIHAVAGLLAKWRPAERAPRVSKKP